MINKSFTSSGTVNSWWRQRNLLFKWVLMPAAVAIIACVMQWSVSRIGLDLHHDTLVFDAARQLLHGELPFKDFFSQYNLASIFFHTLSLKILGESIASLKMATVPVYSLIALLIYACVAVRAKWQWALATALAWATLSPFYMPQINGYHAWSTIYMIAALMCGGLCLLIALRGRILLWAVLAGIFFGVAFWCKQIAVLQIFAVLLWVCFNALRLSLPRDITYRFRLIFIGIVIGVLASLVPFFFYIFRYDLFDDWWQAIFVFNGYFAASGNSSTGMIALARTFFPINRELGYVSVLWAMLPLGLIAIIAQRHSDGGGRLFSRSDECSLASSLFAAMSIAGWFGYFPLAHSFHAQLFMAPMFVLLALQLDQHKWRELRAEKRRWPLAALLIMILVTLVYQAHWHIRGLYAKVVADYIVVRGNMMPASGIRLAPEHAFAYYRFLGTAIEARRSASNTQLIPMSVDPLRALLPIIASASSDFKMGMNWTFQNEIVEPGFNKRLALQIAERKSLIYADSLIGIPGYVPIGLLEMQSPMTKSHTLYAPSADKRIMNPPVVYVSKNDIFVRTIVNDEVLFLSDDSFRKEERQIHSNDLAQTKISFVKLDKLASIPMEDIAQLHVSLVKPEDFPAALTKFQYEIYMRSLPGELAERVSKMYEKTSFGRYELKWPLDRTQKLEIGQFLLSQGKLFKDQDRPIYFSTLGSAVINRPFIVKQSPYEDKIRVLWPLPPHKGRTPAAEKKEMKGGFYIALSHYFNQNEDTVLYVQIVMNDNTSRNYYLYYQP